MAAKFYTVWKGHQPGVYNTWGECQQQIRSFRGAVFKSFLTKELAEKAFSQDPIKWIGNGESRSTLSPFKLRMIGEPIMESISVYTSLDGNTNMVAWRGVFSHNREEIFRAGPYKQGSIKLGDFLAIVGALQYCSINNCDYPIYSDSITAIKWVKEKSVHSQVVRNEVNEELYQMADDAIKWIIDHRYTNPVLRWEVAAWGDNLADPAKK